MTLDRLLWWILLAGLLLRMAVWSVQTPESNDQHFAMVEYLNAHGKFPTPAEVEQAWQPPLYYLVTVPLASLPFPQKAVQAASLLFALINLCLLYRLISQSPLLSGAGKVHALLFAAFLPEFILFGNYVTNDSLAFLLTTACCWAILRVGDSPTNRNIVVAGILLGLGLMTKASFVPLVPVLALLVWLATRRPMAVALLLAVSVGPGALQLAATYGRYGHALTNAKAVSRPWVAQQQDESKNWASAENLNPMRLLRKPYSHYTREKSYPIAMYATFYFPYIIQDGITGWVSPYPWLPGAVYTLALIPTLAILSGIVLLRRRLGTPAVLLSVLALAGCAATVITAMIQFQVWSFAQGRYLFPYMFPLMLLLGTGMDALRRRIPPIAADALMVLFCTASLASMLADTTLLFSQGG